MMFQHYFNLCHYVKKVKLGTRIYNNLKKKFKTDLKCDPWKVCSFVNRVFVQEQVH